jgi:hypothetical protein
MPVPALGAVQAKVDVIGRHRQVLAPCTSRRSSRSHETQHTLFHSTNSRDELNDVAPGGIKLAEDRSQPCLRVAVAWRELEEKASRAIAQDVAIMPKSFTSVLVPLNRFT